MRLIYKFRAEGVWFSKRGGKAYLRGEKPKFLWSNDVDLEETGKHHIATRRGHNQYSRPLVMFYREASISD